MSATPKSIPPKYFYDSEGSRLFEEITRTPEYYPTRSEHEILRHAGGAIVQYFPTGAALVEFGSGACVKVRFLLDAAKKAEGLCAGRISGDFLAIEASGFAALSESVDPAVVPFHHLALPEQSRRAA